MAGIAFVVETLFPSTASAVPTWMWLFAACVLAATTVAIFVARIRAAKVETPDPEPDYAAMGQRMLEHMDATIAARKAAGRAATEV